MRFITVLVLIAIGIAALGWYRGWFFVTSENSADKPSVTVTVDKDKMHQDEQKALDKAQDLGREAKDRVATPAPPTTNPTRADVSD